MTANNAKSLEQTVAIETPEQVVFSYTVAGIGSRAAAALIDHGIIFSALLALVLLIIYVIAPALGVASMGERVLQRTGGWIIAILGLVQFILMWGYYLLFEALWDGQTPGKRWLKLRVVQDGGFSVSFSASAARNLVRILDMQPIFSYLVGMIAVAFSKTSKRLGDQLAGTIVVRESIVPLTELVPMEPASQRVAAETTAALSDEELELLQRFSSRIDSLDPARREGFVLQLADRFQEHIDHTIDPLAALRALLERERSARAQGAGVRGQTGAGRERYRLMQEGAARWNRFAVKLSAAQKGGLAGMSAEEVAEFVADYREIATDLARLSTAARGREDAAVFQLSRLVAGGHNLLYRRRVVAARQVLNYLFGVVPAELRRSTLPILFAALLLFGSGTAAYLSVVRDPALIEQLVPAGMIDRAEQNAARVANGDRRYIDVEDFARAPLATRVMTNNVQIAITAFASGLTAGVLTVLILLMNGVSIGAVFGLFQTKGVLALIAGFALAHSVFELSAICIAAGGGFLIAKALLLPGALTRRQAMVEQGRRALRLLTAAALFLFIAGLIEGLLSPRAELSWAVRGTVAGLSALAIAVYVAGGGPPPHNPNLSQ